jgi:hypothetical protein
MYVVEAPMMPASCGLSVAYYYGEADGLAHRRIAEGVMKTEQLNIEGKRSGDCLRQCYYCLYSHRR